MQKHALYYDRPVDYNLFGVDDEDTWNEATPIGSGNMGAMIFGGVHQEKLQMNEDTIWYGDGSRNRVNPEAKENYLTIRKLLRQGDISEAEALAEDTMMPMPDQQRNYTTAGEIKFCFHDNEENYDRYARCLDLNQAVVSIDYRLKDIAYKREYFASAMHQVIAVHQTAEGNSTVSGNLSLAFFRSNTESIEKLNDNMIALTAKEGANGCRYCIMIGVKNEGGTVAIHRDQIRVKEAKVLTFYITIRSDFYKDDPVLWCKKRLEQVMAVPYSVVKKAHIQEYQTYFNRVDFTLGDPKDVEIENVTIPKRLANLKKGKADLQLIETYFHFGRYLLISSSRPGSQPANLQGIWNRHEHPAWGSKYTININTEMNYWPAESCNLSECHLPLFDLMKRMLPKGRQVAKEMYGLSGFVAHHNTDLFGDCAPQDAVMPSTLWPLGAAWLGTHIWQHYEYSLDKDFLAEHMVFLKEAACFLSEFLFENEEGNLVTGPSISPENTYIHANGEKGQLCIGPSMDTEIVSDLFNCCIQGAKITQCEDELTEKLKKMVLKLPKLSIGKHGQLMEWAIDYEEEEPGHRHISHLYALYPSNQLSYEKTPKLMEAARITLNRRLAGGGGHTGWSRAWIITMWARLRDGEKASENLNALLEKSTYPNLFDCHPPFQIDGNFGGTAGIVEMLFQCQDHVLTFLPALPSDWESGSIKGLKAKGAIEVSFKWKHNKVYAANIKVIKGGRCIFIMPEGLSCASDQKNVSVEYQGSKVTCMSDKPYTLQLYL